MAKSNPAPIHVDNRVIAIDALIPHDRNYRSHPDSQLERLASSLQRFTQYRSIVVQEQSGGQYRIVAGHGLVEAAKREHLAEMRADVLPASMSEEDILGILVADNLTTQSAEDDLEALAALLQEQANAGYHLETLGSSQEELDALLEELAAAALGEETRSVDDPGGGGDDFDPSPDDGPTRSQPGDLWQLGPHRLLVGDSTKPEDVQRLMGGRLADCLWSDPPYGVDYVGKTKDALTIQNDGKDGLQRLLSSAFAAADSVLKEGAAIYIAHPPGAQSVTFGACFLAQGWRLHETLVWVKDSMVLGHSDYHYRHEPILYGYKSGEGRRGRGGEGWYGDNSQTSVFEFPRPKRSEEHPTMKPCSLVVTMLNNSCPKKGVVYDAFLGSGTTLIAADRCGMVCAGLEIDPRFADVILARFLEESGIEPVLLERLSSTPESLEGVTALPTAG